MKKTTAKRLQSKPSAIDPAASEIAKKLSAVIPQIMSLSYRLTRGMACPEDFTIPQFKVIQNLGESSSPLRMSELSQRLGVSQSTLTDTVKRLVVSKHIYRERSAEDDRLVYLSLTSKSKAVLGQHHKNMVLFFQKICSSLDESQRIKLLTCHEFIKEIYADVLRRENGEI